MLTDDPLPAPLVHPGSAAEPLASNSPASWLLTILGTLLLSLTSTAFLPAEGRAAEDVPESIEVFDWSERWDLKRGRADDAPPGAIDADTGTPAPREDGWKEGDAPFVGSYGRASGGTRLSMSSMPKLARDDERTAEERAEEKVYWFARDFLVEDPDDVVSLLMEARFVGGFVVYLNGQEVLRHRLDLENRYQAFGEIPEMPGFVREGRRSRAQRAFRGIDPSALVSGTNTLAVRVHRKPGDLSRSIYFDLRMAAFVERGFVKGPYLQNVTPDSVTIMFESSTISTPYIEYGAGSQLTESATIPSAGGTLHEVTITDLEPDTRYFYRVRAETIWPEPAEGDASAALISNVYYFNTAPPVDTPGFTFLAYGDNRSQPAIHRAVVERMLAEKASFVINTGDLTESGVDYRQWQEEFFEPAQPLLTYIPMWPSLGNHDGNHVSYFEHFSLPGNEAWYSFRYGNAELFALNTVYNMRPGSAQHEWLDKALAESTAEWKMAFFHHPPFSCTPARLPGFGPVRNHIIPLFEKHGVDLVLSGHDHLYAHGEQNGIHYVITGGGGAWSYPAQTEPPNVFCEQVYHYTLIRVEEDSLFLRAVDKDGGEVDAFAIRR